MKSTSALIALLMIGLVVAVMAIHVFSSAPARGNPPARYKLIKAGNSIGEAEQALNDSAREGWKFEAITNGGFFILSK
ncbi:MAG: hypothetical protein HY423_03485 [Candidatus Lambdaproteobacteria bacterium]|nr:hypothetical protein [Candidatus Lambdaproteobacteria bacterium]